MGVGRNLGLDNINLKLKNHAVKDPSTRHNTVKMLASEAFVTPTLGSPVSSQAHTPTSWHPRLITIARLIGKLRQCTLVMEHSMPN